VAALSEAARPIVPLGSLTSISQYGTSKKSAEDDSGTDMLRMGNIKSGHLDFSDVKKVHLSPPEVSKYKLLHGDLLINRTNSLELVGKAAVFENAPLGDWVFASYLIRLRLDLNRALPQYVCAVINGRIGRDYILRTARRAIGMVNINAKEIGAMQIPLPPIDVQQRIVDSLRESREAAVGVVSQLDQKQSAAVRKSLLRQAFAGEL
jgi:type I restriction enzyme S subunit